MSLDGVRCSKGIIAVSASEPRPDSCRYCYPRRQPARRAKPRSIFRLRQPRGKYAASGGDAAYPPPPAADVTWPTAQAAKATASSSTASYADQHRRPSLLNNAGQRRAHQDAVRPRRNAQTRGNLTEALHGAAASCSCLRGRLRHAIAMAVNDPSLRFVGEVHNPLSPAHARALLHRLPRPPSYRG
jgi:hypothetical protein